MKKPAEHIRLPVPVASAIQALNNCGYEAYAVGGCVRDSLLGNAPDDWDITTSATPQEMQAVFADYRRIETGLKHGTLTVLMDEMPLEITTYRVDGTYSDGRHPDGVTFTRALWEDLKRRDFTINAMAYHPQTGLLDLYGGQEDLAQGVLRCVGDPQRRFEEDALRIVRALRFCATLGFDMDIRTAQALRQLSPSLSKVSVERISTEFIKLLCGRYAQHVMQEYHTTVEVFAPEIRGCTDFHLLSLARPTAHARLAALFYGADLSPMEAQTILRRLRMDNKTIRAVSLLLTTINKALYTEDAYLLRLLNVVGEDLVFDYLALRQFHNDTVLRARQLLDEGACYRISMLAVNGNDMVASGITPGRSVGVVLQELLDAVMDGKCCNNKESLLDYLRALKRPVQ